MRALLFLVLLASVFAASAFVEYEDTWTRESNITVNYTKLPWILRVVPSRLLQPQQITYDEVQPVEDPIRLDPRTCPGEIAICYQVRQHTFDGEITYGTNFSSVSSYVLPDYRVKFRYCVGNDTKCVRESTNCFCPEDEPPKPVPLYGQSSQCSDTTHLCRFTYNSFVLCEGNLSKCQEKYAECGCGRYGACNGYTNNVCINARNELYLCNGALPDCLATYGTCFCGDQMMVFQGSCQKERHSCERDGENKTCVGKFSECALLHDVCTCGVTDG